MRAAVYVGLVLAGVVVGYAIGDALVPRGAELETAVYPGGGAIAGGAIGLAAVLTLARLQRRKRPGG